MIGSMRYSFDGNASSNEQCTDAFGCVKFMPRNGQQIDTHLVDMRADLADTLCRVGMNKHVVVVADFGDVSNRLDDADFIVGVHHTDHQRFGTKRGFDVLGRDNPLRVARQNGDRHSATSQVLCRLDDRWMLDGRNDQVPFGAGRSGQPVLEGSDHGQIVRFGAAGGEDHFVGICPY